jgi:endo-1,4-beta-xylanase
MNKMKLSLIALMLFAFLLGCVSDGDNATAPPNKTKIVTLNTQGADGGYFYSFWTNGGGTVTMSVDGANGYRVGWSDCGNFTCGKGWSTGSGRTVSYTGYFNTSGQGLYGIYGWTTKDLVEYYVVEAWGEATNPATSGTFMGKFESDGDTYTVYKHKQTGQPSIQGTADFMQYKSFRQTPRTSGTITVQNHFDAWTKMGMPLGTRQNYQILLTEGISSSGSAGATITEVSK